MQNKGIVKIIAVLLFLVCCFYLSFSFMNVILEVSVPDVVDVLADHKTDAAYKKAMELAKKEEETSQDDFVSLFVKYWKQEGQGRPLAAIFATQQMKGLIQCGS